MTLLDIYKGFKFRLLLGFFLFFAALLGFGFLLQASFVGLFGLGDFVFGFLDPLLHILVVWRFVLGDGQVLPCRFELVQVRVSIRDEEQRFWAAFPGGRVT